MKTFVPTKQDVIGTVTMLRASNCLPRWSAHLQNGYTEVSKQALNCQIATILFELVAHEGKEVNTSLLPRIAIFRAFEKYQKCDITEESYAELFADDPELEKRFLDYINTNIINMTSFELFEHISGLENTFEMQIYKAATAIATYIEALEIKPIISSQQYSQIIERQKNRLKKYKDFPIVRDILSEEPNNIFELFKEFSRLRNRIRWVKHAPIRNYSVLGHSYDVAVINYLFCLSDNPNDISRAERGFFVGLFHDLAENWTGDMPSPIKDGVLGLREKTEDFERKVLNTYVFPSLPEWLVPKFKELMLELIPDKSLRNFYKIADDFAATVEAATQLTLGSKDKHFIKVVISSYLRKSPIELCNDTTKYLIKETEISTISILIYKINTFIKKASIKTLTYNYLIVKK